ncbi:hypothetical protein G6F57_003753 [Rhizopus arrhizus]|uniref:Uncharacterized protein n=1 Tax=Rhizopus oryzae TaxID=64495 RepID=A0A9P6X3Z3_RHIOR|nr:hypothetical protein G6F23_008382 [Rhizopus arrhizus]KAG1417080.1 hypothetical protein G6F58_005664 [Rhizopus delemar]KAG0764884.1 hypothetical protein G6F24_004869 [Rhizopus arrhizus]KAG0789250.1 hypothetical protein G6F21_006643 [Rhizopus arrhizus]KAG0810458.1 hypothetical protein G6F20_007950 [Rhizopus arrhizus]
MTWQVAAVRRGTARMMDSSQFLISVDKRDRGTWYTGPGLKNAACYGRNGLEPFSASVTDMIGAMAMHDFEMCYKYKCAGCEVGSAIDLTPKAFKELSKGKLDIGVLDISFKPIKCSKRRGLFPNLPLLK